MRMDRKGWGGEEGGKNVWKEVGCSLLWRGGVSVLGLKE